MPPSPAAAAHEAQPLGNNPPPARLPGTQCFSRTAQPGQATSPAPSQDKGLETEGLAAAWGHGASSSKWCSTGTFPSLTHGTDPLHLHLWVHVLLFEPPRSFLPTFFLLPPVAGKMKGRGSQAQHCGPYGVMLGPAPLGAISPAPSSSALSNFTDIPPAWCGNVQGWRGMTRLSEIIPE